MRRFLITALALGLVGCTAFVLVSAMIMVVHTSPPSPSAGPLAIATVPSEAPSLAPTSLPTPSAAPSLTAAPSTAPTLKPTAKPTPKPTAKPAPPATTPVPVAAPTAVPPPSPTVAPVPPSVAPVPPSVAPVGPVMFAKLTMLAPVRHADPVTGVDHLFPAFQIETLPGAACSVAAYQTDINIPTWVPGVGILPLAGADGLIHSASLTQTWTGDAWPYSTVVYRLTGGCNKSVHAYMSLNFLWTENGAG